MTAMKLYYNPRPNPMKVALYLEEAKADYNIIPIDLQTGEQFSEEFLALNPNAKVPTLVDEPSVIFDSTAILTYLVGKLGKFGPGSDPVNQGEFLSWLLFIASGLGPFSGQAVHFQHYAPKAQDHAVNRYSYEANRHWDIIETRLGTHRYMLGDKYSTVDMSLWGWATDIPYVLDENAWDRLPNLKRWQTEIEARDAVGRVKALAAQHPYKTEIDDETLRVMFPQNERLK